MKDREKIRRCSALFEQNFLLLVPWARRSKCELGTGLLIRQWTGSRLVTLAASVSLAESVALAKSVKLAWVASDSLCKIPSAGNTQVPIVSMTIDITKTHTKLVTSPDFTYFVHARQQHLACYLHEQMLISVWCSFTRVYHCRNYQTIFIELSNLCECTIQAASMTQKPFSRS